MIFETNSIYAVDPQDNSLRLRAGSVRPINWQLNNGELNLPLYIDDVKRHDLAVFGHSIDETGVREDGFLVVTSSPGILATEAFLLENPAYQTSELARKIATLDEQEVLQLGIDGLICVLSKQFPQIKGFKK